MPRSRRARSLPLIDPVSSATGTGHRRVSDAVVLLGQHLGRRHQRGLFAGLDRAQHRQQRHQRLAGADIALQQPQHPARRGEVGVDLRQRLLPATRSAGIRTAAWRCRAIANRRSAAGPTAPAPGRGSAPWRPGRRATRHRPAEPACGGRARRWRGLARCAALRRRAAISRASAAPGRAIREIPAAGPAPGRARRQPGGATARRSAARPARSTGMRSAWSIGTRWSGCGIVSRPLKTSSLPETSSFAPGGICASRVNLKNTSSAMPVSSLTMIRQGWREVAGRSCRTTSTASVATVPGLAARMVGRALRSR